jgi:hypothetical protein
LDEEIDAIDFFIQLAFNAVYLPHTLMAEI